MGLTLKQLAIWLFFASTAAAADIELYDDPDSCSGSDRAERLHDSAGVGFVSTGTLQVYSRQNDQFCGVPISAENNTPVCIVSHLDLTISAALYRNHRVSRRMDFKREIKYQKAQLGVIKDGKQYLISHEKEAKLEPPGNRKGADYTAYVIQHADVIRDYVPAKHENITSVKKDS